MFTVILRNGQEFRGPILLAFEYPQPRLKLESVESSSSINIDFDDVARVETTHSTDVASTVVTALNWALQK